MWRTRVVTTKGRSFVQTYLSKEGAEFKEAAGWIAKAAGARIIDGPVNVIYTLHPKVTKKGEPSKVRLDLGNAEKVASDALNGIAWNDDKQLARILLVLGTPKPDGGLTVEIEAAEFSLEGV